MDVAFDECGYTGAHLLDEEQTVFALASTSLSASDSEDMLKPFVGRIQGEYKYTKLKRASRNNSLILDVLRDSRINATTCKVYVIHKPFMVVSKIIDNIYEPMMREGGIDLYESRAALATANLLFTTLPVFIGDTRFRRLLGLYSETCRKKDRFQFSRFEEESEKIYARLEKKHPNAAISFAPIVAACRRGYDFIISQVMDNDHDPILPSYHILSMDWSSKHQQLTIIADESRQLSAHRDVLLKFSDPQLRGHDIDYYGRRIHYPLQVADIVCQQSHQNPSIQMADILAGASCHALNSKAKGQTQSEHEKALFQSLFEKGVITGCIWPGDPVTPNELNATGEYPGDIVDYGARILQGDQSVINK